jgi:acyl-ACP thioesterase
MEKGVPARITDRILEAYPVEEKLPMNYAERKITLPAEGEHIPAEEIVVKRHHLDTNNHVNNGQYIRMAMDCLPDKALDIKSMRAEYKKQALLGDVLYPDVMKVSNDGKLIYTINLKDGQGKSVCTVELK